MLPKLKQERDIKQKNFTFNSLLQDEEAIEGVDASKQEAAKSFLLQRNTNADKE